MTAVHSAEAVQAAVERVLARPEYRPPRRSLLRRAFEWVGEQIGRLLDALSEGGVPAVVAWALLAGAVVLMLLLVSRAARGVTTGAVRRPAGRKERPRSAAEWRAEAAAHEAAGQWREAVRAHWRALVADLGEQGLIDDVTGRTAGEHRRAVARHLPVAASPFAAATDGFEQAWYGNRATSAADVERIRRLAEETLAAAARDQAVAAGTGAVA